MAVQERARPSAPPRCARRRSSSVWHLRCTPWRAPYREAPHIDDAMRCVDIIGAI
jgi:hypothetical protein